jgi:hypothetical protein
MRRIIPAKVHRHFRPGRRMALALGAVARESRRITLDHQGVPPGTWRCFGIKMP